jgi:hypothetical protein
MSSSMNINTSNHSSNFPYANTSNISQSSASTNIHMNTYNQPTYPTNTYSKSMHQSSTDYSDRIQPPRLATGVSSSNSSSRWSLHFENPLTFPVRFLVGKATSGIPASSSTPKKPTKEIHSRASGTTASSISPATSGWKRDRSLSPASSRSRSPSVHRRPTRQRASPPRTKRTRSPPRAATANINPNTSTAGATTTITTAGSQKKTLQYSHSLHDLIDNHHFPSILSSQSKCASVDLLQRFPNLYIPGDFLEVTIDWASILPPVTEYFTTLHNSVPIIFENTPSTLVKPLHSNTQPRSRSDILEPPRCTYLSAQTANNYIQPLDYAGITSGDVPNIHKPVKFNAKILVCCGLKDPESERIDHQFTRKLRSVCLQVIVGENMLTFELYL